jgi:hypothetical protein
MTILDLLIGFGLSAAAMAAAIWIIASGGSDSNAMAMLFLSVAALSVLAAIAYAQRKTDQWIAQFPGPIIISAPTWYRVLLCLAIMSLAGLFFYLAAMGKAGPRDDWEFSRMVVVGSIGLMVAIGALCQPPRHELVLSLDKLEYRSSWRKRSYRWSEFSKFYLINRRWNFPVCEFAHQSDRPWFVRRGLIIAGPLGVFKYALKTLMIEWQARALANHSVAYAASSATDSRSPSGGRSLLDYT